MFELLESEPAFIALTLLVRRQEGRSDGDDLTGALHVSLQLSPPLPSSLAPVESTMETFWYWLTQVVLENDR